MGAVYGRNARRVQYDDHRLGHNGYDLGILGSKSGKETPDKIRLTKLTPKLLDNAVGFEEAELTFVCKKIYTHKMRRDDLPEFVRETLYKDGDLHYLFMGEIEDVFGTIDG